MVVTAGADGAVIVVNHADGVLRSTGARVCPFFAHPHPSPLPLLPPHISPLTPKNINTRQSRSTACTKWTTTRLPTHTASRTISSLNLNRLISCSMVNRAIRRVAVGVEKAKKVEKARIGGIQRLGRGHQR